MVEKILEELDMDWLDTPLANRLFTDGKREGKTEGIQEELVDGLEVALDSKFGVQGLRLIPELRSIKDINILKSVRSMIRAVNTPEELRLVYAKSLSPQ